MRFSCVAVFAMVPLALGAPILSTRGFLGDVGNAIKGIAESNATLSGIASTVKQSIDNPQLTAARLTVIKGLSDTQSSLNQIDTQANSTGNSGVNTLVATAQTGVSAAHDAINRIGDSLVSGVTPSKDDQKAVAVGIKGTRTAVNQMNAAITTPDTTLSSNIADAVTNVGSLQEGGQGVLAASNVTFADLGLPDDFATSP